MKDKPYRDEGWLKQKYVAEGLSIRAIAEIAGTTPATILRWLKRHKVKTRSLEESMSKRSEREEERKRIIREGVEALALANALVESFEKAEEDAEFLPPEELERREEKRMEKARELHSAKLRAQEREVEVAKLKRERSGKNPGMFSWSG